MNQFPRLALETKRRCDLVLIDFKNGVTTRDSAVQRLKSIEDAMHEENPTAEPDGDITYAVAMAREQLA